MNVELGSFWLIKDSGCIAVVKRIIGKSDGGLTVVYVITNSEGISSHRMSCDYELFTNIAEKLIAKSDLKDELNKEYVKGKTDGYNEGYQHGFTLATGTITTELDKKGSKKIYNDGYVEGHNSGWRGAVKAYSFGKSNSEDFDGLDNNYNQGYNKGYRQCIKDNKQRNESKIAGDFCEHRNPNKETQEAMQEVLDKDDAVNSPKHYNSDPSGVQCIEITRHRNNNIGNVIKYLWRNGLKDGNSSIQDLEKGAWYLNDEIQRLKGLKDD